MADEENRSPWCRHCGKQMAYSQEIVDATPMHMAKGVVIHVYQCQNPECGRKAVTIWEPAVGMTEEVKTFVEREVMRVGAFFPQDYLGNGAFGSRSRFGRD